MSNVYKVEYDSHLYTRPYDFEDASFTDDDGVFHLRYKVFFSCILVREKDSFCIHTFLRHSEMLDNALLLQELGLEYKCFYHVLHCDHRTFPSVFNEIQSFLEYVHQSDRD